MEDVLLEFEKTRFDYYLREIVPNPSAASAPADTLTWNTVATMLLEAVFSLHLFSVTVARLLLM